MTSLSFNTLLFILISLFFGLIYIGLLTILSDITPSNAQGRMMGVLSSVGSLAWALGSWSAGWLAHFGQGIPFVICASCAIGAFAMTQRSKF
jgi:predicted MFS family arabinose efflux permease